MGWDFPRRTPHLTCPEIQNLPSHVTTLVSEKKRRPKTLHCAFPSSAPARSWSKDANLRSTETTLHPGALYIFTGSSHSLQPISRLKRTLRQPMDWCGRRKGIESEGCPGTNQLSPEWRRSPEQHEVDN